LTAIILRSNLLPAVYSSKRSTFHTITPRSPSLNITNLKIQPVHDLMHAADTRMCAWLCLLTLRLENRRR